MYWEIVLENHGKNNIKNLNMYGKPFKYIFIIFIKFQYKSSALTLSNESEFINI